MKLLTLPFWHTRSDDALLRVCCYPMQNLIFSLGPRQAVTRGARGLSDEFDVSLLFGARLLISYEALFFQECDNFCGDNVRNLKSSIASWWAALISASSSFNAGILTFIPAYDSASFMVIFLRVPSTVIFVLMSSSSFWRLCVFVPSLFTTAAACSALSTSPCSFLYAPRSKSTPRGACGDSASGRMVCLRCWRILVLWVVWWEHMPHVKSNPKKPIVDPVCCLGRHVVPQPRSLSIITLVLVLVSGRGTRHFPRWKVTVWNLRKVNFSHNFGQAVRDRIMAGPQVFEFLKFWKVVLLWRISTDSHISFLSLALALTIPILHNKQL